MVFKDIEKLGNPDRHFNKKNQILELNGKSFEVIVNLFKKRIKDWYIKPGEYLLWQKKPKKKVEYGFIIMSISVIILDLLSQYEYDLPKSKPKEFKKFLIKEIPEFGNKFSLSGNFKYFEALEKPPKIVQVPVNTGKFNSYADAFWKGFRCGIVHNAFIMPFGRINQRPSEIILEDSWPDSSGKIMIDFIIHPENLFLKVKQIFMNFIRRLKNSANTILRQNFKDKFIRDFGYGEQFFWRFNGF